MDRHAIRTRSRRTGYFLGQTSEERAEIKKKRPSQHQQRAPGEGALEH